MQIACNPREANEFCDALNNVLFPHHSYEISRRINHLFHVKIESWVLTTTCMQLQERARLHLENDLHQGGAWTNLDCYEVLALVAVAHLYRDNLAIRNTVYTIVGWLKGHGEEHYPLFDGGAE